MEINALFFLINSIILFWDERVQAQIVTEGNFHNLIEMPSYKCYMFFELDSDQNWNTEKGDKINSWLEMSNERPV